MAWRCEEAGISIQYPLVVQVVNKVTKTFQEGTRVKSKIRGVVDMRHDSVQELRNLANVRVRWIPADYNEADLLTKCFLNWVFQQRLGLAAGSNAARRGDHPSIRPGVPSGT